MPARSRTVDFHVHMLEASVFEASNNKTVFTGFGANPVDEPRPGAKRLLERTFNAASVMEDMDSRGIGVAVVTASTVLQGTSWADPELDLELCRRCNDQAADWQSRHPERFVGSYVLPLQDVDRAMNELDRATNQLKLRVGNVSSSYHGVYIGDPRFHPYWAVAHERGLTTWIHPEGSRDPWFQKFALWNSLGQSIEEAKCMASLIYEGVVTRYDGVKIVMAHGGGYFPHYMGRLDRNTLNRPYTVINTGGRTPGDMLRCFHYDACVYDPKVLASLLERVGSDRLVMGSDYPVGEKDPLGWLRSCGVEGAAFDAIAGGNARRLLGLDDPAPESGNDGISPASRRSP
ncbi:amidohydrolase family protein [soil metagenome]